MIKSWRYFINNFSGKALDIKLTVYVLKIKKEKKEKAKIKEFIGVKTNSTINNDAI